MTAQLAINPKPLAAAFFAGSSAFFAVASAFDPYQQIGDLDSKIVVALERLSQAFRVLLWRETRAEGLSPIQVQLLVFLGFHPAHQRSVTYLAQEFHLTKATVSESVRVLLAKQLVEKTAHPTDARAAVLALTPAGEELARKAAGFADALRPPLADLSAGQKTAFYQSLLDVVRGLSAAGVLTDSRLCFSCRYFAPDEAGKGPFCRLLGEPLPVPALRVDCPEHEPRAAA